MDLSRRHVLAIAPLAWLAGACTRGGTGGGSSGAAGGGTGGQDGPVTDAPWTDATALTGTEDTPHALAVDATHAYFTTGGSQVGENAVRVVPLDGSEPSRILMAPFQDKAPGDELVVDGDHLYVAAGASILRVRIADGTTEVAVADRPGSIRGLAVGGGALWWTTGELNDPAAAELCRMPSAGGPIEILAAGIETDKRPYTDDVDERRAVTVPGMTSVSTLVAVTGGVLAACTEGVLHCASGQAPVVLVPREEPVTQLVVDGETVFFLQVGGRTSLYSTARTGGEVVDLRTDLDDTGAIAVADGRVLGTQRGGLGSGDAKVVGVPVSGGDLRTLSHGPYVGGPLAAADARIVFIGDSRLWSVAL